jgi:hypothetical protein
VHIARLIIPIALTSAVLAGCATTGQNPTPPAGTPTTAAAPAGNGIESLAADAILAKAIAAVKAAGSFRMKGSIDGGGEKLTLDFKVNGANLSGTLTMGGGTMKLLKIGKKVFIQGDADFWKSFGGDQGKAMATLLKGKWVKASADSNEFAQFAGFAELADPETLLKPEGEVAKGDVKAVNGTRAVGLSDGSNGTFYIAVEGEPYPVRLEAPNGSGAMDFSDFGTSFEEIKEPAADEIVDLAALTGH